jgi:hypothetical protein
MFEGLETYVEINQDKNMLESLQALLVVGVKAKRR